MTVHEATRTLVKSHPELWAECSDAASLARHLDRFGEIRITRLEPETAVAWEGDHASGTVRLEPSGWGTRVILTATAVGPTQTAVGPQTVPTDATGGLEPAPRPGRLTRWVGLLLRGGPPPAEVTPPPSPPVAAPAPAPVRLESPDPPAHALAGALDSLGRAHHRPYSRG